MRNLIFSAAAILLFGNIVMGQPKIIVESKIGDDTILKTPEIECDGHSYPIAAPNKVNVYIDGYSTNKVEIPYSSIASIEFLYRDVWKDINSPIVYVNVFTQSGKKYFGAFDYGFCNVTGLDSDEIKHTINLQTVKKITINL